MLGGGEGLTKGPRGSRGRVHPPHGGFSAGAAPLGFSKRGVRLICSLPRPEDLLSYLTTLWLLIKP